MKQVILSFVLVTVSLSAWSQGRRPDHLRIDPSASQRVSAPGFLVATELDQGINRTMINLSRHGKLFCGGIEGRMRREGDIDPQSYVYHVSSVGLCVDHEGVTRYVNPSISAYEIRELEMELQQIADADRAAQRRRNDDDRRHDEGPESDSIRYSPYRGASQE
jgi:hypothetical protein